MGNAKLLGPISIILLVVILVLALFLPNNTKTTKVAKPTPSQVVEQTNPPSPNANSQTAVASANIIVTSPSPNQKVGSKFKLTGQARVFENVFAFRLKNKRTNKIYAQAPTMTDGNEMGQFGNFNFEINYQNNSPDLKDNDGLILEVYQNSPKDGVEVDKVTINLIYDAQLDKKD